MHKKYLLNVVKKCSNCIGMQHIITIIQNNHKKQSFLNSLTESKTRGRQNMKTWEQEWTTALRNTATIGHFVNWKWCIFLLNNWTITLTRNNSNRILMGRKRLGIGCNTNYTVGSLTPSQNTKGKTHITSLFVTVVCKSLSIWSRQPYLIYVESTSGNSMTIAIFM